MGSIASLMDSDWFGDMGLVNTSLCPSSSSSTLSFYSYCFCGVTVFRLLGRYRYGLVPGLDINVLLAVMGNCSNGYFGSDRILLHVHCKYCLLTLQCAPRSQSRVIPDR